MKVVTLIAVSTVFALSSIAAFAQTWKEVGQDPTTSKGTDLRLYEKRKNPKTGATDGRLTKEKTIVNKADGSRYKTKLKYDRDGSTKKVVTRFEGKKRDRIDCKTRPDDCELYKMGTDMVRGNVDTAKKKSQ